MSWPSKITKNRIYQGLMLLLESCKRPGSFYQKMLWQFLFASSMKIPDTSSFWIRYSLGPCASFFDANIPMVKFSFFRCLKSSSGFWDGSHVHGRFYIFCIFFCNERDLILHLRVVALWVSVTMLWPAKTTQKLIM